MDPDRVAPGSPSSGVRPIDVSIDLPFWMATAEAPEPRCKEMRVMSSTGYSPGLVSNQPSEEGNKLFAAIFPNLFFLRHFGIEWISVDAFW